MNADKFLYTGSDFLTSYQTQYIYQQSTQNASHNKHFGAYWLSSSLATPPLNHLMLLGLTKNFFSSGPSSILGFSLRPSHWKVSGLMRSAKEVACSSKANYAFVPPFYTLLKMSTGSSTVKS